MQRGTLGYLLHPRHTPPYCHSVVEIKISHGSGSNPLVGVVPHTCFLIHWHEGHWRGEMTVSALFNHWGTVPWWKYCFLGTETSSPAEPKAVGNGNQKLQVFGASLQVSEKSCSCFLHLIPGLWILVLRETATCTDHWFTAHAASWQALF